MGTVLPTKLNIRKEAKIDSAKSGYYIKDDRIEILETKNGWGRTVHGWVYLEYVKLDKTTENQGQENTPSKEDTISDGKTNALGYGVVTLGTLNVRSGPGTNYEKVDTVSYGSRYAYYQKSNNWARIDKGWVSLTYLYIEGTAGEGVGTGYIHSSDLNIRSGPGVEYEKVGTYKKGEAVQILMQINKWGCTDKGWVSMSYVAMKEHPTGTGTVTPETLNIRKLAKVESEKVGTYSKGDKIEILETNGDWGRTDKGWIYLDYVKMDAAARTVSQLGKGTVTASGLHIRKDADIKSESIGGYKKGDSVEILEVKNGWGRTDKGWIFLDYVKMDS